MDCYITATGSFLPGPPICNTAMPLFMGELDGEAEIRTKILRMNGIQSRYYALDHNQAPTHDLYEMGNLAAQDCLNQYSGSEPITYLSAGSTNAPLVGPGLSSILHERIAKADSNLSCVEINSNSGICSASAQALVNCTRAIRLGEHSKALSIGVEQPSDILKSTAISPPDDRSEHTDIRRSKWFMSVFLRSMLSDGAGAMLLSHQPADSGLSYKVNWTYSHSFAHQAPLCMQLESKNLLLSQDVEILGKFMKTCVRQFIGSALNKNNDDLSCYKCVLPHLSSFFFKRYLLSVLREFCGEKMIDYWTNLETVGNAGSASIYIMLDQFTKTQRLQDGEKILLFVPESGQFNFVLISLTAILNRD